MKKTAKTTKEVKLTDLDKSSATEVKGGAMAGTECKCSCGTSNVFGNHDSNEMSKSAKVMAPSK
jgi:hypothetical protein